MRNWSFLGLLLVCLIKGFSVNAQLTAAFSANRVEGCAPLVVQFRDESRGNPSQWKWDLGNGTISFLQNPAATYFNPGTYTVKLVIRNGSQSDSLTKTQFITVFANPTVMFGSSDSTGCFPLSVQFRDLSNPGDGSMTKWFWDFGDGDTSSMQHPQHIYTTGGIYNVSLQATNSRGCFQVISKLNHIRINNGVQAGFRVNNIANCRPPTAIQFVNTSTGTGSLSFEWQFGDGTSSTQTNPTHTYLNPGSYTVRLIVRNDLGCIDSTISANAIIVGTVTSAFSSPTVICERKSFQLSNNSAPTSLSSTWSFGDGTISNEFEPAKAYSTPGSYTIKLVSDFGACKDSLTKTIQVLPKPITHINSSNPLSCRFPLTVSFNQNISSAISYKWYFGDGDSSIERNPIHVYNAYGRYTIKLITTNAAGCVDTLINPDYVQIQRPEVQITNLPAEGCAPYSFSPNINVVSFDSLISYQWHFGDGPVSTNPTPTHVYNNPGTYTIRLIFTTMEGCTDSLIVPDAVRVGLKPIIDFSANPPISCAYKPILFQDRSTGAIGDRWLWRFGDGGVSTEKNPEHIYQDTGWFNITLIVWNNGCSDSLTIPRFVYIRPPIARFVDSSICNAEFTRWFIDRSIGATAWFWDFGDGTTGTGPDPVHTYTQSGSYLVTLTVRNDTCEHSTTRQILIIAESARFKASDTTVCKGVPIVFSFDGLDRTGIRNFEWDFGDGTRGFGDSLQHSFYQSGVFTIRLIITDINGCTDTLTKPMYIKVTGPGANFNTSTPTVCSNTPLVFNDTSLSDGINPIKKWVWNYGDGITDTLISPPFQHSYSKAGNYTIALTVIDSIGCSDRFQRTSYLVISKPDPDFNSTDTISCTNQNIRFQNQSSGNSPINYLWNFGNGVVSTAVQPLVTYTSEGTYSVKLLATDRYGCKDSITRSNYIEIKNPVAVFTISDSLATCPPLIVNFNNQSQNFNRFQWDFGDGTRSNLNNPVHFYTYPGVYRAVLRIFSQGNCVDSMVKTVTVRGPQGDFRYDKVIGCEPTNIAFIGMTKDSVSYVWDFNDGTVTQTGDSTITHTYTRRGVFLPKMILRDPQGCQVSIPGRDTVRIFGINTNFSFEQFNYCDSATVRFRDSSFSNDLITSFRWSFGDGSSSTIRNPSHFYRQPGNYAVKLIATTQFGCLDSLVGPVSLKIASTPILDLVSSENACIPSNAQFNATTRIPDSTLIWNWDFGNGMQSNVQTPPLIPYVVAGSYNVKLVSRNPEGCADTVSHTYIAFPLPSTNAGPDQNICLGNTTQLNASGAESYEWVAKQTLSCNSCANPTVKPDTSSTIILLGKNIYGCSTRDSVLIRVQQPFNMLVKNADTLCLGEATQLFASGSDQYQWSPAAGLSNPGIANPIVKPNQTTLYQVVGTDRYGCFSDTGYVPVQVFPYPMVNAGADQTINVGSSIGINAKLSPDVVGIEWTPSAGLSCTNCPNPVAMPKQTTNYRVKVNNIGGCISVDDITVFVFCENSNLFVPNTFSPNEDGNNDVFYPRGKGLFMIKSLRIFNRWGELVFERNNFAANDISKGWDGSHLGRKAMQDVYVYTIEVMCENQSTLKYGGNIALIR